MAVWIPPRQAGPRVARYFAAATSVIVNANVPTESTGIAAVTRDSPAVIEALVAARRDD